MEADESKDCLKKLEKQVIKLTTDKLEKMIKRYWGLDYHGGCSLLHIAEMVKLAHQVRSLLGTTVEF